VSAFDEEAIGPHHLKAAIDQSAPRAMSVATTQAGLIRGPRTPLWMDRNGRRLSLIQRTAAFLHSLLKHSI
jgi:hypothetical protein